MWLMAQQFVGMGVTCLPMQASWSRDSPRAGACGTKLLPSAIIGVSSGGRERGSWSSDGVRRLKIEVWHEQGSEDVVVCWSARLAI